MTMTILKLAVLAAPAGLAAQLLATPAQAAPPQLSLPLACEIGRTCEVQSYVDRDPSPAAARDYTCGARTYEGHQGVDFRIPSMAAQRAGVAVLASADGRVARVRDGMADVSIRAAGAGSVQDKECGNGVVIAHEDGWETQYCHMARGSIRVKPGDAVRAGAPLGLVGLSGNTEFPHVHLQVRHGTSVVDPFAPEAGGGAACGAGASLWRSDVKAQLAYKPRAVLNAGFTGGELTMAAVEEGAGLAKLDPAADALVAFVRAIGLEAGDEQELILKAPDGRVLAQNRGMPLETGKAQSLLYIGKRKPAEGWAKGAYVAIYVVRNAGAVVLNREFRLQL